MKHLLLQEGGVVIITNVQLPKGTYVKIEPCGENLNTLRKPKKMYEVICELLDSRKH